MPRTPTSVHPTVAEPRLYAAAGARTAIPVRWLLLFAVALALAAMPARAQLIPAQPIDSGKLIRYRLVNGQAGRGRMLASFYPGQPQLIFCDYPRTPCAGRADPATRRVAVTAIRTLDVSRGNRAVRGALVGSVAGAVLARVGAHLSNAVCDRECANPATITVGGLLGGALWGALVGAGIQDWRPVPELASRSLGTERTAVQVTFNQEQQ